MFLDHVTFAVRDLDETVAQVEEVFGIAFETATETIPGITGRVLALDGSFLEFMAVSNSERARLSPFGKKFVQYLEERGAGIFSATLCTEDLTAFKDALPQAVKNCGPISTWVPQPDGEKIAFSSLFFGQYHLMPWVIEYQSQLPDVNVGMKLRSATIQVPDLAEAVRHYRLVYGIAEDHVRVLGDGALLELRASSLRLKQAAQEGLSHVEVEARGRIIHLAFDQDDLSVMER